MIQNVLKRKISLISYESAAGRTTVASNLFLQLVKAGGGPVQLMGYDVEKPDLLTLFRKIRFDAGEVYAGFPKVDKLKCRFCGACVPFCDCGALHIDRNIPSVLVNPEKCRACGDCVDGCQINGIHLRERLTGYVLQGRLGEGLLTIGQADDHEDFLLPLICNLIEKEREDSLVICDPGPGNSDFVRMSLTGTHLAVIIQKPARGWERNVRFLLDLLDEKQVKAGIMVNKYRNEEGFLDEVKKFSRENELLFLGTVPYMTELPDEAKNTPFLLDDPGLETIFAPLSGNILTQIGILTDDNA